MYLLSTSAAPTGTLVSFIAADVDNKYISTAIEQKDGAPGQWKVSLKITKLTEEDVKGKHTLTVTNAEGSTTYSFQLHRGEAPPPDTGNGNSEQPVEKFKGSAKD
jgi:hypothetical protein